MQRGDVVVCDCGCETGEGKAVGWLAGGYNWQAALGLQRPYVSNMGELTLPSISTNLLCLRLRYSRL